MTTPSATRTGGVGRNQPWSQPNLRNRPIAITSTTTPAIASPRPPSIISSEAPPAGRGRSQATAGSSRAGARGSAGTFAERGGTAGAGTGSRATTTGAADRLGQRLWGRRRDCERRWSRLRGGGAFTTLPAALERTLERGEASKDLAREAVAHQHDHEHRHGEQAEQDEPGGEHQAGHLVAMAQGRHHGSEQGAEQARDDDACDHEGAASPARTGARGGHASPV